MKTREWALRVWGGLACFTRPEMKVERFSYPVITPSAARGIFDAIYCKPIEFRWQMTAVEVLQPIAWVALRRNEVSERAPSTKTITAWREGRQDPQPMMADSDTIRQQRQTIALRDVAYRLWARFGTRSRMTS